MSLYGNFKELETLNLNVNGKLNLGDEKPELTISAGAVTVTTAFHEVDTEADASTDDLETISGGVEGDFLLLEAAVSSRTVIVKDSVGNIQLVNDFHMTHPRQKLLLISNGTNWREVSRSTANTEVNEYKAGTTNDPSTTATSSGAAPVLAEMTHTFTPAKDNNDIEVFFSGNFRYTDKKEGQVHCGIFVDGTLQAETERKNHSSDNTDYETSLYTFWKGKLPESPVTIGVRFWSPDGDSEGLGIQRNFLIREVEP